MIVHKTDPISGRRLDFEVEPLDEPGANRSIVHFEDLFQYNKSYADFPVNLRERESVQLMHLETGLRRVAGASPSWWDILLGWIEDIDKYIGPLINLYVALEEAGIITPAQREQAEAEGWTKEQLVSLIRAQMAPAWEKYLPWVITGGIGIGLILVLALR